MRGGPVTVSDARRELRAVGVAIGEKHVQTDASWSVFLAPMQKESCGQPASRHFGRDRELRWLQLGRNLRKEVLIWISAR